MDMLVKDIRFCLSYLVLHVLLPHEIDAHEGFENNCIEGSKLCLKFCLASDTGV